MRNGLEIIHFETWVWS